MFECSAAEITPSIYAGQDDSGPFRAPALLLFSAVVATLDTMGKIHLDLMISGKVQGVRYRKSAVEQAVRLNVKGFAMNMSDGAVRIEAEGSREELDRFVEWCRTGPPRAVVDHIDVTEGPIVGHAGFLVRR